jgi:hypothetical protein
MQTQMQGRRRHQLDCAKYFCVGCWERWSAMEHAACFFRMDHPHACAWQDTPLVRSCDSRCRKMASPSRSSERPRWSSQTGFNLASLSFLSGRAAVCIELKSLQQQSPATSCKGKSSWSETGHNLAASSVGAPGEIQGTSLRNTQGQWGWPVHMKIEQ